MDRSEVEVSRYTSPLLIGFALGERAKVNLGRVYDRKKLSTEIGDAAISPVVCLAAILAVSDQKAREYFLPCEPLSSLLEWVFSIGFVSVIIP